MPLLVARILWGCSGGDDASNADVDAATDGTNTDSSPPLDGAPTDSKGSDTGGDARPSDSGIDAESVSLHCGSSICTLPADLCCVPFPLLQFDASPYCNADVPDDAGLLCPPNVFPFECIDSTQCKGGKRCFAEKWADAGAPMGGCLDPAGLQDSGFAAFFVPLCASGADCADGAPCTPYECLGNDLSACGTLDSQDFQGCTPR